MWIKGKYQETDSQGRQITRDITLNLSRAICYATEREEDRTRIYFKVGHDLEDMRNASWIDLKEPKAKIDKVLGKPLPPK